MFHKCSWKKQNKKKNKNKSKNEQTGTRLYVLEVKIFVWKQEMKQNVIGLILDSSYSLVLIKRFKGIKNYFVLLCEFGVKIQKHFQIKEKKGGFTFLTCADLVQPKKHLFLVWSFNFKKKAKQNKQRRKEKNCQNCLPYLNERCTLRSLTFLSWFFWACSKTAWLER